MKRLRIGIRAHDFGRCSPEELARRVMADGFDAVQLALGKAIMGCESLSCGQLSSAFAGRVAKAFALQGVEIAVLGCYINPIHPDTAQRRELLALFQDHLRCARDFGCGLVALESGSVSADYSPHPANHEAAASDALLESLGELVTTAEQCDVCVGLEAVTGHTVSTARKMREVLDRIGSRHLRVVFDPVNLLSADNFQRQTQVTSEALNLLGAEIAVVHAKDFVGGLGALQTVPAGQGELDYAPVMEFIRERAPDMRVLLEGAGPEAAGGCAGFLQRKFEECL